MIQITTMSNNHTAHVAQLEKVCFQDPWSEKSIRTELTNPLSLWLVAMDDQEVIGYVGSQSVVGEADMMNLAVAPEYRRNGVGAALVDALVTALRQKEVTSLTLEVRASNESAKSLYARMGFLEVGRRPNYYRNPKEDALILRKEWLL